MATIYDEPQFENEYYPRRSRRFKSKSKSSFDTPEFWEEMHSSPSSRRLKPNERQQYSQWIITFAGFFVLAIVVGILVGWLQEKAGSPPQSISGYLMFAILFSVIGTVLLNVGLKIFMPKARGGPAFFITL